MEWTRGGDWSVQDVEGGRWWAVRAGDGEAYSLTRDDQLDQILADYLRFARNYSPVAVGLAAREANVLQPNDELVRLLVLHGPLGPTSDVPGSPQVVGKRRQQGVWLAEYRDNLEKLGRAFQRLELKPTGSDRDRIGSEMLDLSAESFREVEVIPRFRADRFGYDVRPWSLRALLWERLFRKFNSNLRRLCRYCGEPFEAPLRPGRAREYCDAHARPAFRQAYYEGRAPTSLNPGRLNQEED